jgi:hypothetical protein
MPKVDVDLALLAAVEAVVRSAGGNESEAARRLGTTRLRINRVRKQRGGVTASVRQDLWKRLELASSGSQQALTDTFDTQTIQIVRDVPAVALQVLRYMADVIERDIGPEGQVHA